MKNYITVRFDEKTKDLINQRLSIEANAKNKHNQSNENRAIKKYITDALERYVNKYQSSQLLETEAAFLREYLIEKINPIMNNKLELLELIIKDYFFVREGYEND